MTTRFFGGTAPLDGARSREKLGERLDAMPGDAYLQCRDRDAIHLLNATDMTGDLGGKMPAALSPTRFGQRLRKLLRALDKGQGGDFARAGTEAGDDGLSEKGLRSMAEYLVWLCDAAEEANDPVVVLCFSRQELGMKR